MILVCGGAGYIGSHAVRQLIDKGEEVIIVDNLETGHEDAIHPKAKFYKVDIRDEKSLNKVFEENKIDEVIHFAANSLVGESMTNPLKYFNNNVHGILYDKQSQLPVIYLMQDKATMLLHWLHCYAHHNQHLQNCHLLE